MSYFSVLLCIKQLASTSYSFSSSFTQTSWSLEDKHCCPLRLIYRCSKETLTADHRLVRRVLLSTARSVCVLNLLPLLSLLHPHCCCLTKGNLFTLILTLHWIFCMFSFVASTCCYFYFWNLSNLATRSRKTPLVWPPLTPRLQAEYRLSETTRGIEGLSVQDFIDQHWI